jgi:hypothetical protein
MHWRPIAARAIFLGDGARRLGGSRSKGRKQEIDPIVADEFLGKLNRLGRGRLVIVIDDIDHTEIEATRNRL